MTVQLCQPHLYVFFNSQQFQTKQKDRSERQETEEEKFVAANFEGWLRSY